MQITEKKVVAISYKLSSTDPKGEKAHLETVDSKNPMYFLAGHSGLPEKFENHLEGLKQGDSFNFELDSEDAFGDLVEEEIMNLPLEDFLNEEGKLDHEVFAVGKRVPMTDENEDQHVGRVLEINEAKGYIKLDFNHPLAGLDLHFDGKVELVRDAKPEEMEHGHVHGEGGHHH
ncbi:MAG: peptidylprolyl isomerase [Cytophagales bacterium]